MTAPDVPPRIAVEETAIDTLARTLWGEARGDTVRGKEAIACVVLNRVRATRARFGSDWWGGTVVEACLVADQFACWRCSPAIRKRLMQVRSTDPVFAICRRIAARAVRGALVDPTRGATHYHWLGESPAWAVRRAPSVVIGRRRYYNLLDPRSRIGAGAREG